MVLRLGSLLLGGVLLAPLSGCSDDAADYAASGGVAGTAPRGGTAGAGAGQGGRAGAGGTAGLGGAGAGAGRGGSAGASAGRPGDGGAASGQAGQGGEGGDGTSGAGGDAGGSGSGGEPGSRWDGCPTADDYTGDDDWENVLEVTEDAVYCAKFDESRTLKQELAQKALLRIAPGTYRLPTTATANLGLPTCIAYGEAGTGVAITPGSAAYTATPLSSEISHRYTFDATAPAPERELTMSLDQVTESEAPFDFTLDGRANAFDEFDSDSFSFVLCEGTEESCYPARVFDSCTHESSTLNRHELTLDVGTLVLDLRIGMSAASTEPGAFVRAAGSFKGHDFEQTNYFRLIYKPEHHHFERNFAVLFDEPLEGACGIEIGGFSAFDETTPSAYTVDCELDRLDTLTVTDFTLTRDP